ncbi:uncharacterized protein LOC117123527 isoform X2 [Anneissia japonica]|uniref:uncharacterized protein LOC117123527 isoform X2 n=1 Tax=Anneissia japonica TaxID=1529436 RepID=UPI0014258A35|nr:uncharacterized protein LOC117123527 isoform X2 [Anneissia japonica]
MLHNGQLRTLVQRISKKKILPSWVVISSNASTTNEASNQSKWSQKKHTKQKFQRHLHTSGKCCYNCNTPVIYEPWMDEDIICVLQGSCMPGSTRYCRTNSMFGKMDITDIMQGVPFARKFSTLAGNPRFSSDVNRYHHTFTDGAQSSLGGVHALKYYQPEFALFSKTKKKFSMVNNNPFMQLNQHCLYSTSALRNATDTNEEGMSDVNKSLSQRAKLKRAVKEYGGTVVVFHVCISLASLGGFYLAVSSGLDMATLLKTLGFSTDMVQSKLATGASTFVVAYAVHKMFAPVRIGITLTTCPFLVRYLRRVGILKVTN